MKNAHFFKHIQSLQILEIPSKDKNKLELENLKQRNFRLKLKINQRLISDNELEVFSTIKNINKNYSKLSYVCSTKEHLR